MDDQRNLSALPLGEGTETGSERSGLANPCPGRPEQADDSRIAVSPSPDRSATALKFKCPFCGRAVETFEREGVQLMLGHRVSSMPTPGTPWCQGGGRSPS